MVILKRRHDDLLDIPRGGLVLFAPLYLLDGTVFSSKDVYGHLCTKTGTLWTPGGEQFYGTDDVINCGDNVALDLTAAITLWAWVKSTVTLSTADQFIVGRDTGSAGSRNYYIIISSDTTIQFSCWIGGVIKTAKPGVVAVTNEMALLGGTYDGANLYGWKNLTRGAPAAAIGAIDNGDVSFTAGLQAVSSGRDFTGLIPMFGVYNRALTVAEWANLYLATKWVAGL